MQKNVIEKKPKISVSKLQCYKPDDSIDPELIWIYTVFPELFQVCSVDRINP